MKTPVLMLIVVLGLLECAGRPSPETDEPVRPERSALTRPVSELGTGEHVELSVGSRGCFGGVTMPRLSIEMHPAPSVWLAQGSDDRREPLTREDVERLDEWLHDWRASEGCSTSTSSRHLEVSWHSRSREAVSEAYVRCSDTFDLRDGQQDPVTQIFARLVPELFIRVGSASPQGHRIHRMP